MKQHQFTVQDDRTLMDELRKLQQWVRNRLICTVLIQLYTETPDRDRIEGVSAIIRRMMPEALFAGCSSNGNIVNGDFSTGSIAVICTLFEYPSTQVELLQYELLPETQAKVAAQLVDEVERRPWVKAVELLVTIRGMSMTSLCEGLSHVREGVQLFGGGAFSEDLEQDAACVFSGAGGYQEKGIVFLLLGGEEFHVDSSFVTGWKPLGSFLHVTAAEGYLLRELNHLPAYETYYKYLHIRNDENFFSNTLEFPFLYRHNGIDILRAPVASNPDGSLTMTSDMEENVQARIAYGDPRTILDYAWEEAQRLRTFAPECVFVFSCAGRRTFWGNEQVGKETEPYQLVAPTAGFYTSSEFLRTGRDVNQHNVTQVIAAMREGEAREQPEPEPVASQHSFDGKVSMISRMATFIKATTEELEEANRKLSELAVTDAMTGVGNKTAYLEQIRTLSRQIHQGSAAFTVFVFDLNGLKTINDSFGHEWGDLAITETADALKSVFGREHLYRIGGDEFIALWGELSQEEIDRLLGRLDEAIALKNQSEALRQLPIAVASGAAAFCPATDRAYREVFRRADEAMYQNKAAYYQNRT